MRIDDEPQAIVTRAELSAALDGVGDALAQVVNEWVVPLRTKLARLEMELIELRARLSKEAEDASPNWSAVREGVQPRE